MQKDKYAMPIDGAVRAAIYDAYAGVCQYTGEHIARDDAHVDHIIPRNVRRDDVARLFLGLDGVLADAAIEATLGRERDSLLNYTLAKRSFNESRGNVMLHPLVLVKTLANAQYAAPSVLKQVQSLRRESQRRQVRAARKEYTVSIDSDDGQYVVGSHDATFARTIEQRKEAIIERIADDLHSADSDGVFVLSGLERIYAAVVDTVCGDLPNVQYRGRMCADETRLVADGDIQRAGQQAQNIRFFVQKA